MCICACADNEEDDEEESLEVKEGRLYDVWLDDYMTRDIAVLKGSPATTCLPYLASTYHSIEICLCLEG